METQIPPAQSPTCRSPAALAPATFCVVLLILFLRDPQAIANPVLHCEDGRDLFAFYFNHREWQGIFRFYAGYVSLLPNLLGYLAILLPTVWVPTVLSAASLLLAALGLSMFSWSRFRPFMADDRHRALACATLAILPLGNYALLTTTMYSHWSLLFALLLLSLAPFPRSVWSRCLQLGFMSAAIWSHPASVMVVPLYIYRIVVNRPRDSMMLAFLIVVAVGYQLFGVVHGAPEPRPPALVQSLPFVLSRVVTESILGTSGRLLLGFQLHPYGVFLLALAVVAIAFGVSIRHRKRFTEEEATFLAFGVFFILVLSLLFFASRGDAESIFEEWGHRYSYVQRLFFVLMSSVVAVKVFERIPRRTLGAIAASALFYIVASNYYNNRYYEAGLSRGLEVQRFVTDLGSRVEASKPGERIEMQLDRGVWTIAIDARAE